MRFKIVFFDCDGVLIFDRLWDKLHRAIGLSEELDTRWFKDYYAGKLDFKDWIDRLENFYREKRLDRRLFERKLTDFTTNSEAMDLIEYLKQRKFKLAIISSGIDFYVEKVANKVGIFEWRTNYLFQFDQDGLFTKMVYQTNEEKAKVHQVQEICLELSVKPTDTIFIGDSINDVEAFKYTQHEILYKPEGKPYKDAAWRTVNDLREIKGLF